MRSRRGPFAARALLTLAQLYERQDDLPAVRKTLGAIVKRYPLSGESDRAREWLAELDRPVDEE